MEDQHEDADITLRSNVVRHDHSVAQTHATRS